MARKRSAHGQPWTDEEHLALLRRMRKADGEFELTSDKARDDVYWAYVGSAVNRTAKACRSKWVKLAFGHQSVSPTVAAAVLAMPRGPFRPWVTGSEREHGLEEECDDEAEATDDDPTGHGGESPEPPDDGEPEPYEQLSCGG